MTTLGSGNAPAGQNGHRPPALGDVTITRGDGDTWDVHQGDQLVAAGLTFQKMLRVVRGELPLDELAIADKPKVSEPDER